MAGVEAEQVGIERPMERVDQREVQPHPHRERREAGVVVNDVERIAVAGRRVDRVEAARDVVDLPHGEWIWSGCSSASGEQTSAGDSDPGGANSVTRCPASARPAASRLTTCSIPPYPGGGIGIQGGARMAR